MSATGSSVMRKHNMFIDVHQLCLHVEWLTSGYTSGTTCLSPRRAEMLTPKITPSGDPEY